ncbi:MAG: leucyl/phenylalanyl-tRNA--protein transferase, partial [Kangiellaceae bacterium]|nr:leucyl/phenylalanyl-tRNA--protein transferase [Kangiellaceae bacterium]
MLPYLTTQMPFPPVNKALNEPNGLLAAGGDLSAERLIQAYSHGIFPWYSEGEPILWWSPDPRMVFFIDRFKVRRSVKQTLKRNRLAVTLNSDFEQVMRRCSLPRSEENGT